MSRPKLRSLIFPVHTAYPQEASFPAPTFSLSFLICKMSLAKGGRSLSAFELAKHLRLNVQIFDIQCMLSDGADMGRAGQLSILPSQKLDSPAVKPIVTDFLEAAT